ncbi:MAG: TetR/AcrR family transcriptional regulator [Alphaproteobacteria bacterium]
MGTRRKPEAASPAAEPQSTPGRAPRLWAAERRELILNEAALFFADHGFQGTTRELARRLGITQAALYKHFPGKKAIFEAIFERSAERWRQEDWRPRLADRNVPIEIRLGDLYAAYVGRITGPRFRLFVRAGLDGLAQPARRGAMLTATILEPVIEAARIEAGLPGPDQTPILHREREIAMALHGALMFLAVRKHVYRMPMADDFSDLVRLQVRLWVPGVVEELRRLHASRDEPPVLSPRPNRRQSD